MNKTNLHQQFTLNKHASFLPGSHVYCAHTKYTNSICGGEDYEDNAHKEQLLKEDNITLKEVHEALEAHSIRKLEPKLIKPRKGHDEAAEQKILRAIKRVSLRVDQKQSDKRRSRILRHSTIYVSKTTILEGSHRKSDRRSTGEMGKG
ncbi:hypothetical protein Trydic_g7129 [Trypoxylus dichotomus]